VINFIFSQSFLSPLAAGNEMGVEGDEQEAEKAADDGRDAVNGRILAQFLDLLNHWYLSSFSSFAAIGFPCPPFYRKRQKIQPCYSWGNPAISCWVQHFVIQ